MMKNKSTIFCGLLIAFILIFFGGAFVLNGLPFLFFFRADAADSFMDFYNSLSLFTHGDPYNQQPNYPPLAMLLYKIIFQMIPYEGKLEDGFYIRDTQAGSLLFIIVTLSCCLIVYEMLNKYLNESKNKKVLFAITILFSGPFLFTYERGNIIFVAFILTMFFVFNYESRNKYIREASLIALAAAFALKLYPAVFGVLLLEKKKFKEVFRTAVYALLLLIVPFVFFNGLESFNNMLAGLRASSESNFYKGLGSNYSFFNFIKMVAGMFGIYIEKIPQLISLIPIIICICLYLRSRSHWIKSLILVIAIVWIPNFSFSYTFIFFTIPLIFYLNEKEQNIKLRYLVLFLILFIPYVSPSIKKINAIYGTSYFLTYGCLIQNIAILLMVIFIAYDSFLNKKFDT